MDLAATRVVDEGTTGPADSEPGTDASTAGLYRMASASPIEAISRFAIRLELDDSCRRPWGRKSLCGSFRSPEPPQERNRPAGNRGGKENVKPSTLILGHRQSRPQSSSASRFTAGASGFLKLEPIAAVRLVTGVLLDLAIEWRQPSKPWSTAMLAEIFMLRLEAAARAPKEAAPAASSRFIPLTLPGYGGVLVPSSLNAPPDTADLARELWAKPGHH
jgi:hypothetical protein